MTQCSLCNLLVKQRVYQDNERVFCCAGCHAVFQILSTQDSLDSFQDHPLFQQAVRSGIISNPDALEKIRSESESLNEQEIERLHMEIQDLWCASCAEVIRLVLFQEKGIKSCQVDYCTDLGMIEYSPRYISKEKIYRIISNLGYRPVSFQDPRQAPVSRALYFRFIIAAFFSLNIMMFSYPIYASYFDGEFLGYAQLLAWVSMGCSIPVLLYSGWPIWRRLFSGLSVGVWGMECLVGVGVAASMGLSLYELMNGGTKVYFDSLTIIIVFVLLGKIIESRAKFRAKDSLMQLMRALPRRGRKITSEGEFAFVPIKEILPGDKIEILMGERVVLDGVVEEGGGSCDESVMTGESWPVAKQVGSSVLSGSILQQGRIVVRVTVSSEETTLFRIIDMVGKEVGHKSAYVRAADPIVRWFVPWVVVASVLTAAYCFVFNIMDGSLSVFETAFIRALSVLLISCPCAIGIAAPLAESYLLNAMAKLGALVRNRGALAYLGKESCYVFDKTGTITEGRFTVLKGFEELDKEHKKLLKALVQQSNHPIAVALNLSLKEMAHEMDSVEEVVGRGIKGIYKGASYFLGSETFLRQHQISIPQNQSENTTVWFAKDRTYITSFVLGDRVRPYVDEMMTSLKSVKTILLSGDSNNVVQNIAKSCHFDSWESECHPLQKKEFIDNLRKNGEIVAMLGDGINDAPALASSHVGISVVSASDISIQVSDILLTTDRLSVVSEIRELAKKAHRIIRQNLFWAFFYNVIGIGLAMMGVLSPIFAAFAMVMSSFIVLINAQRIRVKG